MVLWDSLGYAKISSVVEIRYFSNGWRDSSYYFKDEIPFFNQRIMQWSKQ